MSGLHAVGLMRGYMYSGNMQIGLSQVVGSVRCVMLRASTPRIVGGGCSAYPGPATEMRAGGDRSGQYEWP